MRVVTTLVWSACSDETSVECVLRRHECVARVESTQCIVRVVMTRVCCACSDDTSVSCV